MSSAVILRTVSSMGGLLFSTCLTIAVLAVFIRHHRADPTVEARRSGSGQQCVHDRVGRVKLFCPAIWCQATFLPHSRCEARSAPARSVLSLAQTTDGATH